MWAVAVEIDREYAVWSLVGWFADRAAALQAAHAHAAKPALRRTRVLFMTHELSGRVVVDAASVPDFGAEQRAADTL